MRFRNHAGWVAVALLVAGGCGGEHAGAPPVSTSTEEADVTGVVKVRGKPVTNGTVTFHSANIGRATRDRTVPIKKDGTYSLKAYVGQNTVSVDCKELASPKNREFRDFEALLDIQSGSNTKDIEINPENRDPVAAKPSYHRD
jgi:hypothetical protein